MFKKTKRFASLLVALAMFFTAFTVSPISFNSAGSKALAEETEVKDTAFLMFADGDWSHSYFGDEISWNDPAYPDNPEATTPNGVTPVNAEVKGRGKYTVKLNFSDYTETPEPTEEDPEPEAITKTASGINFMAIGIKKGEINFPGWTIKLVEVKVNGNPIQIKGTPYTSADTQGVDEGTPYPGQKVTTRMNIYNAWVSSIDPVADLSIRTYNRTLTGLSAVVVDKLDFEDLDPEDEVEFKLESIEVTFIYSSGEKPHDTAYLWFTDANWAGYNFEYDFNSENNKAKAVFADVYGEGEYTVSWDFSEMEYKPHGMNFTAVLIREGELTYPGYFIKLKSIKINGKEIGFSKGYTTSDNDVETRMNLFNQWVAEVPEKARTYRGTTFGASPIIVDIDEYDVDIVSYEVTFEYIAPEKKDTAYIAFADGNWSHVYMGEEEAPKHITPTNAEVTGEGTYTVKLELDPIYSKDEEGNIELDDEDNPIVSNHASGVSFMAVRIKTGEETFGGYKIRLDSIKVNGEEIEFDSLNSYTSSDDGVETRINIYNAWVDSSNLDPATDLTLRCYDNIFEGSKAVIVNGADFGNTEEQSEDDVNVSFILESIEITFTYIHGAARVEPPDDFDYEAALRRTDYNAYFWIQTEQYVFRNNWDEASYGKGNPEYFNRLTGWDANDNPVDYGATITDAPITGNGTYTVSLKLGNMKFAENDTFIRVLAVSTDISPKLFKKGYLTVSNVSVKFDNKTQEIENVYVTPSGEYASIVLISEYIKDVGKEPFAYTMPTDSITITFTISGFAGGVDKSALQARYDELKDKKQGDYTDESYKAFKDALEAAKAVLDKADATQQEIDEALANLNQAFSNLKTQKKGCKNAISAVIFTLALASFVFMKKKI
jgi:hypothetical protein